MVLRLLERASAASAVPAEPGLGPLSSSICFRLTSARLLASLLERSRRECLALRTLVRRILLQELERLEPPEERISSQLNARIASAFQSLNDVAHLCNTARERIERGVIERALLAAAAGLEETEQLAFPRPMHARDQRRILWLKQAHPNLSQLRDHFLKGHVEDGAPLLDTVDELEASIRSLLERAGR